MAAFEDFQGLLPLLKKYGSRAATGLGVEAALGSPMTALGALPHMLPGSVKQTGKNLLFGGPGRGAPPQDSPDYAPPVISSQPSRYDPTSGTQPTDPTQSPLARPIQGPQSPAQPQYRHRGQPGWGGVPGFETYAPATAADYARSMVNPGGGGGGFGGASPGTISSLSPPNMMAGRVNDMLSSFFGTDIGELANKSIQGSMQDDAIGREMFKREHEADLTQRYIQQAMMMEALKSMPQERALALMQQLPMLSGVMGFGGQSDPRMGALKDAAFKPFIGDQGQGAPVTPPTGAGVGSGAGAGGPAKPKASFLESALHTGIPALASTLPYALPQTRGLGGLAKLGMSLAGAYGANKGMNALDPGYAEMDPSGVGQGFGVLAGLLGGGKGVPKLMGGGAAEAGAAGAGAGKINLPGMSVNPLPSLSEAEAGLGAATGGQPGASTGVNVAPMQQTEAATMGTPPFANQGVSMSGAQPTAPSMTPIMQTQAMQPRPQPPQNMLEWLKAYYGGQLPQPPQQPQQ